MSQFGMAILNAKAIGQCEILENIETLNYDVLMGELEDGTGR